MPEKTFKKKKPHAVPTDETRKHMSIRLAPEALRMVDEMVKSTEKDVGITIGRTAIIERSIREAAERRGITAQP